MTAEPSQAAGPGAGQQPPEHAPHVVVVGGGLAGLAAALAACDGGLRVTLLEKRHRLGGATWSFERHGISYDNGQHVFMRCFTSYRDFLARIGSADKVHLQPRLEVPVLSSSGQLGAIKRNRGPAPLHLLRSLLSYPHLSFKERLAAVRTAMALRRLGRSLPPDIQPKPGQPRQVPVSAGQAKQLSQLDSQTFGSWLHARGESRNAIEKLWNLIVLPTANLPADEVSLLLAARIFVTGLLTSAAAADIGWSKVPLSELHAVAAAAALRQGGAQVLAQAEVVEVTAEPLGVALADANFLPADAVVLAVPHQAAGALLPPESVSRQGELANLGESPIINVHLVYDQPVCEFDMLGVVDNQAQFVFDRTSSAQLADGRQCLGVSLSAADGYLAYKPQELIELVAGEVERLFPQAREVPRSQEMVTKEVAATFRGAPGSNALRPDALTAAPGVFLAGAWTDTGWPATMEGAVRSGIVASNCVLAYLRGQIDARQAGTGQASTGQADSGPASSALAEARS